MDGQTERLKFFISSEETDRQQSLPDLPAAINKDKHTKRSPEPFVMTPPNTHTHLGTEQQLLFIPLGGRGLTNMSGGWNLGTMDNVTIKQQ